MAELDMNAFAKNVKLIAKVVKTLEETILLGWPGNKYPTQKQAEKIVAVYSELSLFHMTADFPVVSRWYLAGQIVARIERDVKDYDA